MNNHIDRHESEGDRIYARVRGVIIHGDQILMSYTQKDDFYFFPGGHMIWGESIPEATERELKEELGDDVKIDFKKILFIRELIEPEIHKHSIEFFVLCDVNLHQELEGRVDPEHEDHTHWITWLDLKKLPSNILPKKLAQKIVLEYQISFPNSGEYVGVI